MITLNSHTPWHPHANAHQHPSQGILLAMCSNGGGVNHPCPWPLAALISGERWSRTRSISNAAGNDTSPAPPGPWPRKASQPGPAPPLLPPTCMLFSTGRRTEREEKKKKKERDCTSPFLWSGKASGRLGEAERQPGGFYLGSHPLELYCSVIVPSLFVFVSLCHTHTHKYPTHSYTRESPYMHSWTWKQ